MGVAHSRHRRFIAPGAIWDLLVGVEILYPNAEVRFDLKHTYELDYLFGGNEALIAEIAANNAAAVAAQQAEQAAAAGLLGKRDVSRSGPRQGRGFINNCQKSVDEVFAPPDWHSGLANAVP